MSKEQRVRVDAMMRQPRHEGPVTIEELRAGFRALMARMKVPDAIRTEPTELGGRPALRVEPDEGPRAGTILYFHGGAWVFGSPETALSLTGHLVTKTGFGAYSVDYRLAPEHPFPAAIEDTLNAYRALLDRGEDPAAIVFAGDSAGLDATRSGQSMDSKAGIDPVFTRADFERTSAMYFGDTDPHQPLLSPAVHADLTGFPPMLLQVGTNELLLDDSTRLAARAREAGVDVVLDVTADVPHVFQALVGELDEAEEALDRAALFLAQRIRAGARA